jgi:hypothetical protein
MPRSTYGAHRKTNAPADMLSGIRNLTRHFTGGTVASFVFNSSLMITDFGKLNVLGTCSRPTKKPSPDCGMDRPRSLAVRRGADTVMSPAASAPWRKANSPSGAAVCSDGGYLLGHNAAKAGIRPTQKVWKLLKAAFHYKLFT